MGDESEAPGTAGCAGSGGRHAECHCEHVSFLMGKYPKMGMDAIVHRLDRLDNAKDGLEEDVAGILDDQSAAEKDMEELRAERDRYRENLELALEKQQRVVDSLLHLVEDMSRRLKRLEELQPLASGPELPAKPAAAELVERVKTLRSAMDKPMGGPAEAPYAPPRVDPGALPFVPVFSESTMLGEHTAPAGSMREGHVTTDPRSLTVQMSHAAQDLPITTTAHAVYAEEEIQSQTMQGRTMGSADGHGRGHPGGNRWAKDPNTGIWTADGASPSRIPNPMGSGPTGPHSMEERDVRGVYSHPPATGGIRLGGVVAGDVGDAIRIDDLRGIKIPYYDGNPSNLDDFILDWEDFAEEVVGEMRGAPRDKWVCRTFPHRLAQDLKEELRDQIREGLIRTEQACLQWLEDEERVDAPNQKLEDLWSIPLPLDRGELRVREWNRYLRKYRKCLKLVEDWNEASEIRHLLKDVLPGNWKSRVEDEEKKRAKKRVAVRIMAAEDTHAGIMEFFRRNLGEPNRMLGLKNAVYVKVFGDSMGQRLLRLNNVEWRRGEPLRMQVIFARMSLDEIVKYITVELKLNAKNEAHCRIDMVMDNEATEKTAIIGRSRRTRPTPRRMVVEVAKTTGPRRITRRPISSRLWRTTRGTTGRIGPNGAGWDPRRATRQGGSGTHRSRSGSTGLSTTGAGSVMARDTTMHTITVSARCMRRTRRPTSPPTPRRSPRSSGFPIGRRRAETGEKGKAKAKENAEEEAMVVDLAKTDE